jgi:hypothetical protein
MTDYKALTYINLPLLDIKKAPGDTISDEEFIAGGQTPENIEELLSTNCISTNMDAPVDPAHEPVPIPPPPDQTSVAINADDIGKGVAAE